MDKAQIGLIGLSTMGANLARNFADKKIPTIVFNRTTEKTETFIKHFGDKNLTGEKNLRSFVSKIERPRKIILMVKAGEAVDELIKNILQSLDKNDILIDCGNSHFKDTQRRQIELKKAGIYFIGCGVSGGEEGALKGPSIMPGGDKKAYLQVEPLLKKIAAKDFTGKPCVSYLGENGAGHFVKMVHNGIEYGIMELIAEAYDVLRKTYKLQPSKIGDVFNSYNKHLLTSYLFEIAVKVLKKKDPITKEFLVDKILDKAQQKGTGKWTSVCALDLGQALPTITSAVFARIISGEKLTRTKLSKLYQSQKPTVKIPLKKFLVDLEKALYAAVLLTYLQGYDLIKKAALEEKWNIDLSEVSRIWQGGCIIRADLLKLLRSAHSISDKSIRKALKSTMPQLKEVAVLSINSDVPAPAFLSSLSYFYGIIETQSPANLIQGLRDYFGAHTYERIDKKGSFHSEWN